MRTQSALLKTALISLCLAVVTFMWATNYFSYGIEAVFVPTIGLLIAAGCLGIFVVSISIYISVRIIAIQEERRSQKTSDSRLDQAESQDSIFWNRNKRNILAGFLLALAPLITVGSVVYQFTVGFKSIFYPFGFILLIWPAIDLIFAFGIIRDKRAVLLPAAISALIHSGFRLSSLSFASLLARTNSEVASSLSFGDWALSLTYTLTYLVCTFLLFSLHKNKDE